MTEPSSLIDEPTITVLYNDVYGGWGLSKKVLQLYAERTNAQEVDENVEPERHDPVLVQIYNEFQDRKESMGKAEYCRIKSKVIPAKYQDFYVIEEYDGLENVYIDYRRYILHHVNLILQDNALSNDEKVQRMTQLDIPSYLPRPREFYL